MASQIEREHDEIEKLDNNEPIVTDSDVSVLYRTDGSELLNGPSKIISVNRNTNSAGWTSMLIIAGVTCCLGSALPAGYNIGVMNNADEIMKNFCNHSIKERYNIEIDSDRLDLLWSTIVSIFLIGGVTGSLTSSHLANKFGRKGALAIGNVCGIIGALMFYLIPIVNSIELFLLGRLIVGLSGGLATSLLPTYMTEVAPLKLRGAVGVLCQLGICSGVLLGQIAGLDFVLGTKDHWNYMLSAFVPLCTLALILTFSLPESPKYLYVMKGEKDLALQALSRFRNMDRALLNDEISHLEKEIATKSTNNSWSLSRILREPSLSLPLMLVCCLQLGQQLSGINAVFYYSKMIFKEAGLDVHTSQYATIGTGLINFGMAVISVVVMSHFGRRFLLLWSAYLATSCLVILCIAISLIESVSFMKWVCITAVQFFVLVYGIGLGPIPYFIGSELFDVGPRSAAMSLGSVCNWGGNFIVGMTFTLLQKIIGPFSFLIFAATTLFLAMFCRKYLPETRGKTTTEIAVKVSHGLKSRPNESISSISIT